MFQAVGDGVFLPNQGEEIFMLRSLVSKGHSTCSTSILNSGWLIAAVSFTHAPVLNQVCAVNLRGQQTMSLSPKKPQSRKQECTGK